MSQPPLNVSFRASKESKCPVCGEVHRKEELLSGGGRLIAGKLGEDLRRHYEESKKWGKIEPLVYPVQVCHKCLYASYSKDFEAISKLEVEAIRASIPHRQKLVKTIFGDLDFSKERDSLTGAASYLLAVDCYHLRALDAAPTPKKAVSALRAAWMLDDLFIEFPQRPYDKARDFYYMEATRNYAKTLEIMTSGQEPIEASLGMLGPSLDHPWAFDGIIYLNALLTYKFYAQLATDRPEQKKLLETAKRFLSKLYGSGKSSKSKPSVIVDLAKDLYDGIGKLIEQQFADVLV